MELIDSEKIEVPDVVIKEWVWSKSNPYLTPEPVKAEQIGWGVPTIQRLWFGYVIILCHNYHVHSLVSYIWVRILSTYPSVDPIVVQERLTLKNI